jgi:phosphoacetylglucosamine mutase
MSIDDGDYLEHNIVSKLVELDEEMFPTPVKDKDGERMTFGYGTAGFRTLGDNLDQVCFRVAILVAIRAKMTGSAGMMITASHNPKDDNGVKIIEDNGDVLPVSWEPYAEQIVNSSNLEETIYQLFETFEKKFKFINNKFLPNA